MPRYLKPPPIPGAILNWFSCQPDFPAVAGDIAEEYQQRVHSIGLRRAKRWYWRESFRNAWALTAREVQRTPGRTIAMAICLVLAVNIVSGFYVLIRFWPHSLDTFRLVSGYFHNRSSVLWDPIEIVLIPSERASALVFQFLSAFLTGWVGARQLPGREWALTLMFTLVLAFTSLPAAAYLAMASESAFLPALQEFALAVGSLRLIGFWFGSLWVRHSRIRNAAATF